MSAMTTRLVLLALIAMLVLGVTHAAFAHAQEEDDENDGVPMGEVRDGEVPADPKVEDADIDADDDDAEALPEDDEAEEAQQLTAKTIFLGEAANEQFVAGQWVESLVSFSNNDEAASYTVRFAAAHLNNVGDANAYVQNFTGNSYERTVEPKQTASFRYRFQPHESLDPRDYNLVIRLFFADSNNQTLAIAGFNNTISIQESSGADVETVMTFVTIFGLIGGAVYFFQNKKGAKKAPRAAAASPSKSTEMGSKAAIDNSYISEEHLKYQEAMNRKSSSSPKKNKK